MIALALFLFLLIAFVYASVGFGGGSLYLALLSGGLGLNLPFAKEEIRFIALLCNEAVTAWALIQFIRAGNFPFKRNLLLIAFSSPFAFWASSLKIEEQTFLHILGFALALAALALLIPLFIKQLKAKKLPEIFLFPIASAIGFLSGITGIGGGVYLSPFLYFSNWGNEKEIAKTTTTFIAINSFFALIPLISKVQSFHVETNFFLLAVVAGGATGNWWLRTKIPSRLIRILTSFVLLIAAINLLLK